MHVTLITYTMEMHSVLTRTTVTEKIIKLFVSYKFSICKSQLVIQFISKKIFRSIKS